MGRGPLLGTWPGIRESAKFDVPQTERSLISELFGYPERDNKAEKGRAGCQYTGIIGACDREGVEETLARC